MPEYKICPLLPHSKQSGFGRVRIVGPGIKNFN
jgi:hypothetical protein